jgi:hypothetical protein
MRRIKQRDWAGVGVVALSLAVSGSAWAENSNGSASAQLAVVESATIETAGIEQGNPSALPTDNASAGQAAQSAGPRLGGHVGTATPLVTVSKNTRTIADQFTLLHPIGISFKFQEVVVDFETVVVNPVEPGGNVGLVIDPGVVYNFGDFAAGLRAAWQQSGSNFGLIPLVNKGLVDFNQATWFVEAAFPTFYRSNSVEFNAVLHTGVGF